MKVIAIVACSKDRAIGRDNQIPWYLPADLRFFKKTTSGHHIIMGRKTFESIGKALPKRTNLIVSRQADYQVENGMVFPSFLEAVEYARKQGESHCFVIGGGEIYRQALSVCDLIYYTEVDTTIPDASVFFPELPETDWELIATEKHDKDEQNPHDYVFKTYQRISPITVMKIEP